MCGIAGIISLKGEKLEKLVPSLAAMDTLQKHRGPDGSGIWVSDTGNIGLGHQRLAVLDLSMSASQPMLDHKNKLALVFNGEIYNNHEIRQRLGSDGNFETRSDTESILAAYKNYGYDCVNHLRGMFSFALWDSSQKQLFCARDRFGIKPFYYTVNQGNLYFSSEAKALLPFIANIEVDPEAMAEYFTFQFTIGSKTMFKGINQLLPGHYLIIKDGEIYIERYWDVRFDIDFDHSESYFINHLHDLLNESIGEHLISDVPIGAYISGGIDSSLIALLASKKDTSCHRYFHGRFPDYCGYDESSYAKIISDSLNSDLDILDISSTDFERYFLDVIYHLDFPVAGPGSFPQFMVSKLASEHVKVILGGQGGDEIFGGYARYLVAYFEQCIKSCIDGTHDNNNFVVTLNSIVPNLGILREYKPMIKKFWEKNLFGAMDERYYDLINHLSSMGDVIDASSLDFKLVYQSYLDIFNNARNISKESYFDSMSHFDFKTLLPALLHVEDRMSMAHGLESRVPILDHRLVEFAATVPADIKFKGGQLKRLLKIAFEKTIPQPILSRRDKMGFPVPLNLWFKKELKEMCRGMLENMRDSNRPYINCRTMLSDLLDSPSFSRKFWALLSLEAWYSRFHDRVHEFRSCVDTAQFTGKQSVGFSR